IDRGAIQQAVAAGVVDGKIGYTVGAEVSDGELRVRNPKLVRRRQLTPPAEIDLSADAVVLTDGLAAELAGATTEPVHAQPPLTPLPTSNGGGKDVGESAPDVVRHLNLRARFGGDALYAIQRALSSLRDKSTAIDVELTVRAHSKPEGYDRVSLRNGV